MSEFNQLQLQLKAQTHLISIFDLIGSNAQNFQICYRTNVPLHRGGAIL